MRQAPAGRIQTGRRRAADPVLLRWLTRGMLLLTVLITVLGLLLVILPLFRVQKITVTGDLNYYTADEIKAASGLVEGQEILSINRNAIYENIWKNTKYVDKVSVKITPFSVEIHVTETPNVMYTANNGRYVCFNRSFKVLEECQSADSYIENGFLQIRLPAVASVTVGKKIAFADADVDRSYITDLIDALSAGGRLGDVTLLDCRQKYRVSCVLSEACRIEFGKVDEMADKLTAAEEILARKGGLGSEFAVIDVSDLQKPTYRPVTADALYSED